MPSPFDSSCDFYLWLLTTQHFIENSYSNSSFLSLTVSLSLSKSLHDCRMFYAIEQMVFMSSKKWEKCRNQGLVFKWWRPRRLFFLSLSLVLSLYVLVDKNMILKKKENEILNLLESRQGEVSSFKKRGFSFFVSSNSRSLLLNNWEKERRRGRRRNSLKSYEKKRITKKLVGRKESLKWEDLCEKPLKEISFFSSLHSLSIRISLHEIPSLIFSQVLLVCHFNSCLSLSLS